MKLSRKIALFLTCLLILFTVAVCQNKPAAGSASAEKKYSAKQSSSVQQKESSEQKSSVSSAVATTDDGIKKGGTLMVGFVGEPESFNPDAAANDAAYRINQNIFNKLVKINGKNEVIPDLAKSWEYSEDGKTLTFHLTENVKWHDGKDFSAEDVKWTFDQIKAEKGFASNSLSNVKEIEVKDNNTVVFKLEASNAGMMGSLAWMGTYILPKHLYENTNWLENPANNAPIGTGPFKFVEYKKGENVTLEKNPDFFGHEVYLDKIIYKLFSDDNAAYQAWVVGEVDLLNGAGVPADQMAQYEGNPDYVTAQLTWPNKSYLCFNVKDGVFSNRDLREAVLYGLDREMIFTKALKSRGAISEYFIAPQYSWAINTDVKSPDKDIKKATELIEKAGYKKNADGYYFETEIVTFPGWDDFVPVLKANFEEMGIKLSHNSLDDAAYDKLVLEDKKFDFTVLGGYQGPDISAMASRFSTDGPMNYGLYASKEMDKELKAGNEATKQEDRAVHYKNVQEILRKDLPVVFFSDKGAPIVLKAYIKGHPATEASDISSEAEYSNIWIDNH